MMNATGRLDVISCGTGMPPVARELGARADHVYASAALLALLGPVPGETHAVRARAREDARDLVELAAGGARVAVLASGDALYNGMGGTVAAALEQRFPERALPFELCFHPHVTAFQTLFHKAGIPWTGAELFSAHWTTPPLRAILEAPLAVVYGGSAWPASRIAAALLDLHPASSERACLLAEDLGRPAERIARAGLRVAAAMDCGPTSILVLLPGGAVPLPLALGLPDSQYTFEAHLITAPEVRAVALSRLRLPSFGTIWDLGAGSGSVGLEAAALRPRARIVAVERDGKRCAMIRANALALGVHNHELVEAGIMDFLSPAWQEEHAVPRPDRVFVGGGGQDLGRIVEACVRLLAPGGLLVASAVTMESVALLTGLLPELARGCVSLDVAVSKPLGPRWRQLAPGRRIHLFSFGAARDGRPAGGG